MALVTVEVVRVEGDKPRYLRMDDFMGDKGEEVRSGASRIEALQRQARRGELHSVRVLDGKADAVTVAKSDAGRVADLEAEIAHLRAALEAAKPVKRTPKAAGPDAE